MSSYAKEWSQIKERYPDFSQLYIDYLSKMDDEKWHPYFYKKFVSDMPKKDDKNKDVYDLLVARHKDFKKFEHDVKMFAISKIPDDIYKRMFKELDQSDIKLDSKFKLFVNRFLYNLPLLHSEIEYMLYHSLVRGLPLWSKHLLFDTAVTEGLLRRMKKYPK